MEHLKLMVAAAVLPIVAIAQDSEFRLTARPPSPVTQVSVSLVGRPGGATYCYFIVAIYPRGKAPSQPVCSYSAPSTLTGSNYLRINWQPVGGATGYDIVRLTSPTFPGSGTCSNCAIATNTAATFFLDQGGATSSYTISAAPDARAGAILNNKDYAAPRLVFDTDIQMPVLRFPDGTSQSTASAGGGVQPNITPVAFAGGSPTLACTALQSLNTFEITLTGNVSAYTLAGCNAGQEFNLREVQDGTGNHTVAGGALSPRDCVDPTPNSKTTQRYVVNAGGTSASKLSGATYETSAGPGMFTSACVLIPSPSAAPTAVGHVLTVTGLSPPTVDYQAPSSGGGTSAHYEWIPFAAQQTSSVIGLGQIIAGSLTVGTAALGTSQGYLFDTSMTSSTYVVALYSLPPTWTGAVTAQLYAGMGVASSGNGNFVIYAATYCNAPGTDSLLSIAYNTAQPILFSGTSWTRINPGASTALTMTGCSPGGMLYLKLYRDKAASGGVDVTTETISLMGVRLAVTY